MADPRRIIAKPYSAALESEVRDFHCGDEKWAVGLNDFIRKDALKTMKKWGTKVWLYDDSEGRPAGYGSIGTTKWPMPPDGDRQMLLLIPNLAVRIEQQRKGYARQICQHLISEAQAEYEAKKSGGEAILPFLALLVHPENVGAKALYRGVGFSERDYRYFDRDDQVYYEGMGMPLASGG